MDAFVIQAVHSHYSTMHHLFVIDIHYSNRIISYNWSALYLMLSRSHVNMQSS